MERTKNLETGNNRLLINRRPNAVMDSRKILKPKSTNMDKQDNAVIKL